jgi:hypothetical protein
MMGLAAGVTAFGAAALTAAASDERLASRLGAVYGNAERGKRVFRELEMISIESPFKAEDLAEGLIVMNQYGLGSKRNLLALANGAKVAGVSVGELALQVSALQARGLKRFGIEFDTQGEGGVIKFKDSLGKIRTVVAATTDEARKKLMDVFSLKFGIKTNPSTLSGLVAQLRNAIDVSLSTIGDSMLPAAKHFLKFISGGLVDALKDGRIEEWGKKVGEVFTKIVAGVETFFQTLPVVFEAISNNIKSLPTIMTTVLSAAGTLLGVALIEYLKATWSFFVGIGRIIGAAIKESILTLEIPGMDTFRKKAVRATLESMTPEQAASAGLPPSFAGKDHAAENSRREAWIDRLSPAEAAHFGSRGTGDQMATAFRDTTEAMAKAGSVVKTSLEMETARINAAFKTSTGVDVIETAKKQYQSNLEGARNTGKVSVTEEFLGPMVYSNDRAPFRRRLKSDAISMQDPDKYPVGSTGPNGGIVARQINIENLSIKANDTEQLQGQLLRLSADDSALAWGT